MKKMEEKENMGIILSGATTQEASCQMLEEAERGGVREGMLLLVKPKDRKPILARVSQIIPYNAFYTEGDPWSEARRKGLPIPEDVARQYEVCELELLIEIPPREVNYPPYPGDFVMKIDPMKHDKDIFGVSRGDPKHVWYASLAGYENAPVPLNVENIPMHMAVFGTTGSGKSFDTGALIEKLADVPFDETTHVPFPMVIIDANGDYLDYVNYFKRKGILGHIGWIKRFVFPKIYSRSLDMREDAEYISPIGIDLDALSNRELAETIIMYYKGTTEGAELQLSGIVTLFEHMSVERGYDSRHDLFLDNYQELIDDLRSFPTGRISAPTKTAVERSLEKFREIENDYKLLSTKSILKEEDFIDDITKSGSIAVIDFSADGATGVGLPTKQLVMTYLASILLKRFTEFKVRGRERYLTFMIEEAQNFCPDRSYPVSSSLAH